MPTPAPDPDQRALAAPSAAVRALLDYAPDAALVLSPAGGIRQWNARAAALLGRDFGVGDRLTEAVGGDGEALRALITATASTPRANRQQVIALRGADSRLQRLVAHAHNALHDPDICGIVLHLRPAVVEESAAIAPPPAFHDPLTNLPGRAALLDILLAAESSGGQVGALLLDIDRFAELVECHGFAFGDRALAALADRLRSATRGVGALVRFGDTAFVLVVARARLPELERIAAALLRETRRPLTVDDRELWLTASVGVAIGAASRSQPETIVHDAAQATVIAKANGGDRVVRHDPTTTATITARRALGQEIRRAIERQEFAIAYQPIVDLATGVVCEVEALARWRHPTRGLLVAADFIPVAEETGILRDLDRHVMGLACHEFANHDRSGRLARDTKLALNVSVQQLQEPHFVNDVRATLTDARLAPDRLRLEITESFLAQNMDAAVDTIAALRATGVSFALDDFGVGYSSLSYLARIPAAAVKIDKSFVRTIVADPAAVTVTRAMIGLAHAFGMHTVAEGIEDEAQLATLRTLRCDRGQGFLFARPSPISAIARNAAA